MASCWIICFPTTCPLVSSSSQLETRPSHRSAAVECATLINLCGTLLNLCAVECATSVPHTSVWHTYLCATLVIWFRRVCHQCATLISVPHFVYGAVKCATLIKICVPHLSLYHIFYMVQQSIPTVCHISLCHTYQSVAHLSHLRAILLSVPHLLICVPLIFVPQS